MLFADHRGLQTTLAHLIASALGVTLRPVGAPAIDHKGTLASYLTSLGERDVLFIDEIHRLQPIVEEYLYPAMEVIESKFPSERSGCAAFAHGAATLYARRSHHAHRAFDFALRDRFGIVLRLDYYSPVELAEIVRRSALRLKSTSPTLRATPSGSGRGERRELPIDCSGACAILRKLNAMASSLTRIVGAGSIGWASTSWVWMKWIARCCGR